jgi:hypothetical protein
MTKLGPAFGAPIAFLSLAVLAAVVAAAAARKAVPADRRGHDAGGRAPDPLRTGAMVFLGQLAVLVVMAALGAPPLAAEAAALGLGVVAAYAE